MRAYSPAIGRAETERSRGARLARGGFFARGGCFARRGFFSRRRRARAHSRVATARRRRTAARGARAMRATTTTTTTRVRVRVRVRPRGRREDARTARGRATRGDGRDDARAIDRRAVTVAKAALALGEALAFPWLTEAATRPRANGDEDVRTGTRAWFASLLPAERDARAMEEAVAALARGERALGEKNAKAAIEALSKIETLVPREYKLNQRAGLLLSEAYKHAGDNARYLEYKNRVWWWGRGLRWPGWYIIAYLSARSAYFDAKEDDEAAFSMSEAGVVAPLWVGLLFLLVEYGLPDY